MHEQILRAGINLEYEPDEVKSGGTQAIRAASVYDRAERTQWSGGQVLHRKTIWRLAT